MKRYVKDLLKNEKNQRLINKLFIAFIFFIFIYRLISGAFYFLPNEVLFFFTSDIFENFICLTVAFVLYYKAFINQHIWLMMSGIIITISIFLILAFLKTYRRALPFDKRVFEEFTSYIGLAFIFIALYYFFNNLNLFLNNSYVKTRKALIVSEQQLLRQRFNPHFLYNAFNSLYSMSLHKNPKTPESILRLSSMMRYLTDKSNEELCFVKNEIKFINDYIEIEKIRFGSDAKISFDYEGLSDDILLEPLLLIPLVENAFKHGFYTNSVENFISIKAEIRNQILHFTVTNKINQKQHFQDLNRKGKGLINLRKRLNLSYKNRSTLETIEENNQFKATLKINLNDNL